MSRGMATGATVRTGLLAVDRMSVRQRRERMQSVRKPPPRAFAAAARPALPGHIGIVTFDDVIVGAAIAKAAMV